jgi:hypothetical protein
MVCVCEWGGGVSILNIRARTKRNCIYKFLAHSIHFDCFSLCNAKNSDSSIPKPYVLPFTKNRREIVTIQKNDRLAFISFDKAFS